MFWDNELQAAAIQTLLDRTGRFRGQTLFQQGQITDAFFRLYKRRRSFADGERILLEVALDFWNGSGQARFSELYMLNLFEREHIFSLYQALCEGPHAILDWIEGKPQE